MYVPYEVANKVRPSLDECMARSQDQLAQVIAELLQKQIQCPLDRPSQLGLEQFQWSRIEVVLVDNDDK